jgi:hypothetical protein
VIFLLASIISILRAVVKFNNMRLRMFTRVYYFMHVEEFQMCLQTKDRHFSLYELFIVI